MVSRGRNPDEAPVVRWYCGPTGSGKSRAAYELTHDGAGKVAYYKASDHLWWDGYDGVSDVIIDDYRCDFCKFSYLLRLFDRYPLLLNVKGSFIQFRAKLIIVTAPQAPDVMWSHRTAEDLGQLMRRITEVRYFGGEPAPAVDGFNPAN